MVTVPWSELLAPPQILNRAHPRQAESSCGLEEDFQPRSSGPAFTEAPATFPQKHLSPKSKES